MPYRLVLFIFSQVETARHRSRAITLRTHLFLLITHESAVLREVHSIEHSGLGIKKLEERGEHTALIQIIKRKPFCPFLTRKLRACARASCKYDVENGTRSLARSIGRFL